MEENKKHPPLLLETVSKWLVRSFRIWKMPFLTSLIWGMLAYMFAFTNKLINHDEAGQLFGKGATVDSGRWGLGFLDTIFPNVSMPWIYGVITVVLIAISICLILHLFSIRSRVLQVLLSGSIMVFPSLIGVFGYMFTSSSYGLSFLLAVVAVWLVCRDNKWLLLPALCCMVASVSIYQSYISISASLLVLVLIQRLLYDEEPLAVLKQGIVYVLFLILSLGAYYLATQVVLVIRDVSFNDYASDSISFSLNHILEGIHLAYLNFLRFFSLAYHSLIPTTFSCKLHVLLIVSIAILLILWANKQKEPFVFRFLLLLVLIGILPLAINCMYLITSESSIHTLVLYSFVAVYILAAMLMEYWMQEACFGKLPELLRRLTLDGMALALSIIIFINVYTANTAYLALHLRYENAYSFYTALTAQIRQMPEFQEDTKIAVIGDWQSPAFYGDHMEFTEYLVGVKGFLPSSYSANSFMEYYIGFPAEFVSAEEANAIRQSDEFRNMSIYPYYGCMDVIDDVIVVKLSE
ncbi:MAG: glucosyltransferase domain-containing protein [Oscillospiraceae bacterium]|nr:glucosyltransferase domain-containing protein [Oscillospiraceae bacterium]